jgi:AcrR family transcriptional regulator
LSRALILRAALAIIDSDGLSGLTVRKLAARLGVTAMAIYRHFKNKAAIEHELVDLVVGDYDVISNNQDGWVDWLYSTYAKMRHALCAHPGVMPLLDNASYQGGNALTVMDRILGELRRAGLGDRQAAQLFHTLMAFVVGTVVLMNEEARLAIVAGKSDPARASRSRKLSIEMVSLSPYPNIAELAPHLAQVDEERQFRDNVMQIIKAVAEG